MDSEKSVKDRITAYLKDAVRAVQAENIETVEAIGSKETSNAVCCAMEAIFLHGLKGSNTNKNFWPLVKKFTHKATLSQVMELSQISSEVGRCRAWIRIAINDGAVDSYCKLVMDDNATVKYFYDTSAFFRDAEQCNAMQTYLQGLCNFVFDLAFNSTVLNQWTTTTLVLSGLATSGHLDWPTAATSSESRSALEVSFQRRPFHSPSPATSSELPKSSSCPQDLSEAYDSCLQLTQSDIDAIRSMSSALRESTETPVSMLSRPDFTENQPVIYNRLTYGISSESDDHESIDPERTDEQRDLRFERIVRSNLDRYPLDCDRNIVGSSAAIGAGKASDSNHESNGAALTKESNGVSDALNSVSLEDDKRNPSSCNVILETKPEIKSSNPFEEDVIAVSENNLSQEQLKPKEKLPIGNSNDTSCNTVNGETSLNEEASAKFNFSRKKGVREKRHLRNAGDSACNGAPEDANVLSSEALKVNQSGTSKPAELVVDLHESEFLSDDIYVSRKREESFNSMLKTYAPTITQAKMRTLTAIIDELPCMEESGDTIQEDYSSSDWASTDTTETFENSLDEKVNQQAQFLYQISVEKGLREQCYQCRNCARAIGMFYGQDRVCVYDGFHYCHECHENKEHWIPAKVVYNWDFRPYKVSNLSFDYLQRVSETPCLNIEKLNMKLYTHVKPLDTVLDLRTQLRFIKSYMMTCTQDVAMAFMQKFDDQPYLFEYIHLYSLKNLSLVPSGLLQNKLQKIVKFATSHVYSCQRCVMKGFYCEICRATKVIYPFELSSTYRCPQCKAVYHRHCKTHLVPCPKCRRLSERDNSLQKPNDDPIDSVDYSYRRDSDAKQSAT